MKLWNDNRDFISTCVLIILFWITVITVFVFMLDKYVGAAYSVSEWVTKAQVQKAEDLGAIKRTQLEVVNNYGTQDTWNPQQAGKNE